MVPLDGAPIGHGLTLTIKSLTASELATSQGVIGGPVRGALLDEG